MTGLLDQLYNLVLWQIHIYDVIIGIGFAFLIPIIYARIQRGFRKSRVIKFWNIFLKELDRVPAKSTIISSLPSTELKIILNKIRKIEGFVSDVLDENQFHTYLDRTDNFEELIDDPVVDLTYTITSMKLWLGQLISSNKLPFYVVWTTSKIWCKRSFRKIKS